MMINLPQYIQSIFVLRVIVCDLSCQFIYLENTNLALDNVLILTSFSFCLEEKENKHSPKYYTTEPKQLRQKNYLKREN